MIFMSYSYSFLDYAQAQDRIHRIGQHYPCTYYNIIARNTIDNTILYALKNKRRISKLLMERGVSISA